MAEKTTYELKGTLREECMKDTATLDGFRALECDWHELFRWLMSVSGDLPLRDADGKETDRLSCLWKDHVLVVLVEIVRKHLGSYITSFVEGQGTSAQKWFTRKLMNNCTDWILRLDRFIRMSHGYSSDSPAMLVALEIKERLESALPSRKEEKRMRSMPSFMDNRSQPYYQMLGVLEDIQAKADTYMARIESGGDMDASLALLLTMVRNYCGIVSNFNGRFSDWTEFYRREILHDMPKGAVQDGAYVTVIPDRNRTTETFSLPKGTVFPAGKTSGGDDLLYRLDEKAYVVPGNLASVQSVFRKDGKYHTMSLLTAENPVSSLFPDSNAASEELEYGWLVVSRSLVLSEGRRDVELGFSLRNDDGASLSGLWTGDEEDVPSFRLFVSSEEGWMPLASKPAYRAGGDVLEFTFSFEEDDPCPVACTKDVHGFDTEYPAVKILFADRSKTDTLPEGLRIRNIHIRTRVEGMKGFILRGDLGDMDPGQPFYPFGPLGERGSRLVFGHPETALKNIVRVSLKGIWNRLPEKSYREIYLHYGTRTAISNSSFKIGCEWLAGNRWRPCTGSPVQLFRTADNGALSDRAVIELNLDGSAGYADAHDRKGLYRLTLESPEIGFGVNDYYTLYAAAMMHNGKEKEKHHIPVPEMPQVPLLAEASFGYESDETFIPGDTSTSHLLQVSETAGCDEYASADGDSLPLFVPAIAVPSLILGFTRLGDTAHIRLYFSLRYVMTGDKIANCAGRNGSGRMAVSCYRHGEGWKELPQEYILCEETEGLTRSGFIEVQCPEHGEDDRAWLMFHFPEGSAPTDTAVEGVWMNCFHVTAENGDGNPLPAGTISSTLAEDSRIAGVEQPLPGYGGIPAETAAVSHIRERIRISTRGRAVCPGDYEALVIEKFSDIEKACCIPSSGQEGNVTVVVFPKPARRTYPLLPLWKLAEMEDYLRSKSSPFARIRVINPVYEPIDVTFKAVVRQGVQDIGEVRRRLKRRIRRFFCTWLEDGTLPDLALKFSYEALLARVGNDEAVTETILLRVDGARNETAENDLWYIASTIGGVLYVKDIHIDLTENRSGVEEARIGDDFVIR